jgi:hypothetical protein
MRVSFAIIGSGWRAEFFLRIAELLPERFRVTDMVIRDPEKAASFEKRWGVRTHTHVDSLMDGADYSFVVVSVPRQVAPELILQLTERGIPVLCETPPAENLESLAELHRNLPEGARVQVAEQYLFQPSHAARLYLAGSGRLGRVTQAQISAAHDYHGISLMRHFLAVGFEEAEIQAFSFTSPLMNGPGRGGDPLKPEIVSSEQTIAHFHYEGKLGVYDFTGAQYFSWVRSPRILIRGELGEIHNLQVRYLEDYLTPVDAELKRTQTGIDGNLEGHFLRHITLGGERVYRNPFIPGRLSDDEIAVATCLEKMGAYAAGGADFYPLSEASQDFYLGLMVKQAAESKQTVRTVRQPWAPA